MLLRSDRETSSRKGDLFEARRTWYVSLPDTMSVDIHTLTEFFGPELIRTKIQFDDATYSQLEEACGEIREWVEDRKQRFGTVAVTPFFRFSCERDYGYGDDDGYCESRRELVIDVVGTRMLTKEELDAEAAAKKKRKDAYKKKRDEQAAKEINELRNLAAKYPSEMKRLATMRAKKEKKVKK
jgi:hypothetical protein